MSQHIRQSTDAWAAPVQLPLLSSGPGANWLKFGYGPGAELLVPVAIAWEAPFPGSDQDDWEQEYDCCVRPVISSPIPLSNQLSPEDRAFLEGNPDLFDEFGFPPLDYDDPRLEQLESDMALYDFPDDFQPL
jgi:hypothetical protein